MPDPLQRHGAAAGNSRLRTPDGQHRKPSPQRAPESTRALWYALQFPSLQTASNPIKLKQLAAGMQAISDYISLVPPDALLFEIRGSLRHFGGLDALIREVNEQLLSLLPADQSTGQAISPAPAASLLLARASLTPIPRVLQREGLRSALGPLPVSCLPIDERSIRRLQKSGLHHLRDIWRLPGSALRQRLGKTAAAYLDRCLGQQPEPLPRWRPDLHFHCRRETDWPLEKQAQLLDLMEEMLGGFVDFLQRHHIHTQHLWITCEHESRDETVFELQLRQAGNSQTHLLLLLETRLEQLRLPAPVLAICLEAWHFEHIQRKDLKPGKQGTGRSSTSLLLDTLQARLGSDAIEEPGRSDEHLPELAHKKEKTGTVPFSEKGTVPVSGPRPTWLLDAPQLLPLRGDGRPCHPSPLTLLSGPERIETGWWRGTDIRRDYYVASNEQGQRLWIFRCPDDKSPRWFLHGLFA